jgi:hypothetical protein
MKRDPLEDALVPAPLRIAVQAVYSIGGGIIAFPGRDFSLTNDADEIGHGGYPTCFSACTG